MPGECGCKVSSPISDCDAGRFDYFLDAAPPFGYVMLQLSEAGQELSAGGLFEESANLIGELSVDEELPPAEPSAHLRQLKHINVDPSEVESDLAVRYLDQPLEVGTERRL